MTPLNFRLKSPIVQFAEHIRRHRMDYGQPPASVNMSPEDKRILFSQARAASPHTIEVDITADCMPTLMGVIITTDPMPDDGPT